MRRLPSKGIGFLSGCRRGSTIAFFMPSSRTLREGQVIHEKTTVSSSLRLTAIGKDVVVPSGTSFPQHSTTLTAPCSLKTAAAASACFLLRSRVAVGTAGTGRTASAGVSYNKFLAKLASDHHKPDGLFVITPKMGPAFVERLPVEKFHGVGPATTAKMNRLGIETGLDLREKTLAFLQQHFGKPGPFYYLIARGIDERPVRADWIRKSLGAENTFPADIFTFEAACDALQPIIEKVWRTCEGAEIRGRTGTLKVKYADFQQITRSRTGQALFSTRAEIEQLSYALLERADNRARIVAQEILGQLGVLQPRTATTTNCEK